MGSVSFHVRSLPFERRRKRNRDKSIVANGRLVLRYRSLSSFSLLLFPPSFLPSFLPFRGHRAEDWKIANQDYTYARCGFRVGFLFRLAGCEADFLREIRYELGATRLNRIRAVLMHASLTLEIDEVRSLDRNERSSNEKVEG